MSEYCPFVSVIIPTYNRASLLGITLESFINQAYPKDKYEIVVSDNNSQDNTKTVVQEWQKKSPVPLQYIFEPLQGVHYARNTAAKSTRGEILYFTDDDMIADCALLKNLVKVFGMGYNVGSATGKVVPKWERNPPPWILKHCCNYLLSLNDQKADLIIAPYDIGVFSCHQAILREAFFQSGGFNPENTKGIWIGDGETGLNLKVQSAGYKFAYLGDSITRHIIPASRMTQAYLNKRLANQGNCDSYTNYRKCLFTKRQLYKQILSHITNLMKTAISIVFQSLRGKSSWRFIIAYHFYYMSRIRYDLRLIHDEEFRGMVLKRDWLS